MKRTFCIFAALCTGVAWESKLDATIRYANVNSQNPSPPYTNWATAASVIQDAIDVAQEGDEIVVTNGVYNTGGRRAPSSDGAISNRVAVIKSLTIRSVNGPEFTFIEGYQVPESKMGREAVRCVYLTNNATFMGFTIQNGATSIRGTDGRIGFGGGGVFCESPSAVVSNCIIRGNSALVGGGAYGAHLVN